ncbi:hypothetical protein BCR39DRAFT_560389 [Naematelia encephala]|uniref:ER-bound oxygenase mpaB/mpaB'/Rubber oxygenase catalytic domain-containing protein n=1 Tax=Naematelia encephala TaxID=71784 RepID=A0A1Y2AWH9_9TREE|nr:hypothetical protein BCR39DRAFT_560389 [Naematelia encephala]
MKKDLFDIGDFSPAAANYTPLIITDAAQLEDVCAGDVISPLGDYRMEWDQDCVPPSRLEPWRHEGDEICDQVVEILKLRPGQDGLEALLAHLDLPIEEQATCVREFWQLISAPPPYPISAFSSALPSPSPSSSPSSSSNTNTFTPRSTISSPNYNPPATISQGQAVFWRYSSQIFSALLHFSLAGGFSAIRVVNVLKETGYLTGKDRDRTYKRLLETTQAILDYMNDLTPITGIGWKSAIRVRMLHASVRVRLGTRQSYDVTADGLAINQEDMLATLGSFAIAPLWSLRRMGIRLTCEEESAYVAVWRYIGYYLGISPLRLEQYYTGASSVSRASKLFACMTMHLFDLPSSSAQTVDPRTTNTYRLLSAVTGRPPRPMPIEYHLATCRFLLGDGLADRLSLPPTSTRTKWQLVRAVWLERSLVLFGRYYRSGWEVERVLSTRLLVSMVVCWQLGVRRTRFTIKAFGADMALPTVQVQDEVEVETKIQVPMKITYDDKSQRLDEEVNNMNEKQIEHEEIKHKEKEDKDTPKKEEENHKDKVPDPDDDELDPQVTMGVEAGRRIIAKWRWLLIEMATVVLATSSLSAFTAYKLYRLVV